MKMKCLESKDSKYVVGNIYEFDITIDGNGYEEDKEYNLYFTTDNDRIESNFPVFERVKSDE